MSSFRSPGGQIFLRTAAAPGAHGGDSTTLIQTALGCRTDLWMYARATVMIRRGSTGPGPSGGRRTGCSRLLQAKKDLTDDQAFRNPDHSARRRRTARQRQPRCVVPPRPRRRRAARPRACREQVVDSPPPPIRAQYAVVQFRQWSRRRSCASSSPVSTPSGASPTEPLWGPWRRGRKGGSDAGSARKAPTAAGTRKTRGDTKQALLVELLRRAEGATIAEVVEATDWQPHTVRGAFAGALKKRLGLSVVSENVEGRGRVYRIAG